MINNSPSNLKKIAIIAVSLAMAVTMSSCSKGKKNAADPSASASVSVSASASSSASAKPSKKPSKKPVVITAPKVKHKELVPTKPFAKKPYRVTLTPTPEPTLTKKQLAFSAALKKALGLDMDGWNTRHLADPNNYKKQFLDLFDYASVALCSYIQSNLDDLTLSQFMIEVSPDEKVQKGVIQATRNGLNCKPV